MVLELVVSVGGVRRLLRRCPEHAQPWLSARKLAADDVEPAPAPLPPQNLTLWE